MIGGGMNALSGMDWRTGSMFEPANSAYGGFSGLGGQAMGKLAGNFDIASALTQILQQGIKPDQAMLDASMTDLGAQETTAKNDLRNRFSGLGRSLLSSEFASQEQQLLDTFGRARTSARANAQRAGLSNYQAQVSPLLTLLKMMSAPIGG